MKTPSVYALQQRIIKFVSHPDFTEYTSLFRKKWKIPPDSLSNMDEKSLLLWRKWTNERNGERYFSINDEIFKLLEKNNLSEKWYSILKTFLLYDEIEIPLGPPIQRERSRVKGRWNLSVGTDEDARKRDYDDAWNQVRKAKIEMKMSKTSRAHNPVIIRRDNRIYNLHKQGRTTKGIMEIVGDEDFGEQGFLGPNDVKRIISRMKKAIKI